MPNDPIPPGDGMTRRPSEPAFPEPKPQRERGGAPEAQSDDGPHAPAAPTRSNPLTGAGEDVAG